MSLESYRTKKARQNNLNSSDLKEIVFSATENTTEQIMAELQPKILKQVEEEITKTIKNLVKDVRKGDAGTDGVDGVDGISGTNGLQGERGNDGKDAVVDEERIAEDVLLKIPIPKDGSPDTGLEIIEKINPLEEVLNIEVIKGLKNLIKNLGTSIQDVKRVASKGRGGGMSTPQHESFPLTSTTTSVTTSSRIAANGFALWIFFQGQMVARGVGYSQSGKVITLDFTPDDGTYLDIIYFRT